MKEKFVFGMQKGGGVAIWQRKKLDENPSILCTRNRNTVTIGGTE